MPYVCTPQGNGKETCKYSYVHITIPNQDGMKLKNDSLLSMSRTYDFILEAFLDLNSPLKL